MLVLIVIHSIKHIYFQWQVCYQAWGMGLSEPPACLNYCQLIECLGSLRQTFSLFFPSVLATPPTVHVPWRRHCVIYCPESCALRVYTAWLVKQRSNLFFTNTHIHGYLLTVTWASLGAEMFTFATVTIHGKFISNEEKNKQRLSETPAPAGTSQEKLQPNSTFCMRWWVLMMSQQAQLKATASSRWHTMTAFTQVNFLVWWVQLGTCPQVDKKKNK